MWPQVLPFFMKSWGLLFHFDDISSVRNSWFLPNSQGTAWAGYHPWGRGVPPTWSALIRESKEHKFTDKGGTCSHSWRPQSVSGLHRCGTFSRQSPEHPAPPTAMERREASRCSEVPGCWKGLKREGWCPHPRRAAGSSPGRANGAWHHAQSSCLEARAGSRGGEGEGLGERHSGTGKAWRNSTQVYVCVCVCVFLCLHLHMCTH